MHTKRTLTNLLKRQRKLEKLVAPWSAAYGLAEAIAGGHWQVKTTGGQSVVMGTEYLCCHQVSKLVDALDNALPVLTSLTSIGLMLFRNLEPLRAS